MTVNIWDGRFALVRRIKFSYAICSCQLICAQHTAVLGKWDQDPNEFWEASESQFAPNHTFFVKKYCLRNLTNLTQKNNDHVAEPEEAAGFVEVVHTDDLETASYWVTQNVLELQPTPVLGFDIEWRCVLVF